jgi:hypothetical protein
MPEANSAGGDFDILNSGWSRVLYSYYFPGVPKVELRKPVIFRAMTGYHSQKVTCVPGNHTMEGL